jgi:ribosomal-protein-alanine N-acetyltransferase
MFLEVRPSNAAARAMYAAHGFGELTVRRGYYPKDGGREDAILMGRDL